MHVVVVGTAGHIDHGKTSLVKALTGIDCDRLPEERARGITIDLGFASWAPAEDLRIGVVDVPGHERFVKNMVAGTGGLDAAVLVIAADEGVMPQTREHLDICRLLGIPRGIVALTKIDLVDAEWLALVREDVRAFVAGSAFAGSPQVELSVVDGRGLDSFATELVRIARDTKPRTEGGVPRLPIDRVFTMAGFGTVATGTLVAGKLKVGDALEAVPSGARARVRGLHVYGNEVSEARAGMRTAVNLQGLERVALSRGDVLTLAGALEATRTFDADVTHLANARRPLAARTTLLCHIGTAQTQATVVLLGRSELRPGETCAAQIRLDRPIAAMPGDRFILRGFEALDHYGRTVGGGVVIDAHAPRHRRREHAGALEGLHALRAGSPVDRVEALVRRAGHAGVTPADIARRQPLSAKEIERALGDLMSRGRVMRFDRERGASIHVDVAEELRASLEEGVLAYHAAHPERPGIPREELRTRLHRGIDPKLLALLLGRLEGRVVAEDDHVRAASHRPALAGSASGVEARVRERLSTAGLEPPSPKELSGELGLAADDIARILRFLTNAGALVRVRDDLHFAREALDALRERLVDHLKRAGEITTQDFKAMTGLTRKYLIPIQEYFDSAKVTLRVGDKRILRAG